ALRGKRALVVFELGAESRGGEALLHLAHERRCVQLTQFLAQRLVADPQRARGALQQGTPVRAIHARQFPDVSTLPHVLDCAYRFKAARTVSAGNSPMS